MLVNLIYYFCYELLAVCTKTNRLHPLYKVSLFTKTKQHFRLQSYHTRLKSAQCINSNVLLVIHFLSREQACTAKSLQTQYTPLIYIRALILMGFMESDCLCYSGFGRLSHFAKRNLISTVFLWDGLAVRKS